mmetsp:Transcript_16769/g.36965  ORF Transcript_16769/g.36965 Transcript_16769/m.36965 type:complete len:338 (-) Transcript_16769:660-1673(-)
MATTRTLRVVGVNRAVLEGADGIVHKARLVDSVRVDRDCNVVLIGKGEGAVDHRRCRAPILVELQATSTGRNDLHEAFGRRGVAFARKAEVHGKGIGRLQHHLNLARRGRASCSVRARGRTSTATVHRSQARRDGIVDLLWADPVHVHVQTASCSDHLLAGDGLGVDAHNHARRNPLHDVGVACLADTHNARAFDANVGLDDTKVGIDDEGVCNDDVQGLRGTDTCGLPHALPQDLPAAEFALVSVDGEVLLHLRHEASVAQANAVAHSGPEEVRILAARQDQGRAGHLSRVLVAETLVQYSPHDLRQALLASIAIHKAVPGDHALLPSNLHKGDNL